MSLLNQVLQDLQDRQAPDTNTAQATLRDVHIPTRRAARAAPRPWVLWAAIVILAGASGSLLWQRGQQATATPAVQWTTAAPTSSAPLATPAAAQHLAQQPIATPHVPAIAQAETPATTSAPDNTPSVLAAPTQNVVAVDHAPAVATEKAAAAITPPVSKPTVAPRSAAVEKTARPLSPEQQAGLAYQDALRLLQSGRPSAAEPRLRAALEIYPAQRAARTALAGLLINAGRLPEATSVLAAGLALAPTYAPFAKLYARLRIDQGEPGDARAVLERAAPPVQDDPEYHALLAALYQRLGLYEQAARTYRGVLQAQPRNGVWWLGLGLALEGAGDRANALQAYQRAQQSGTLDSEVLRYVEGKLTALQSGGQR